jgi:hypothetical protein
MDVSLFWILVGPGCTSDIFAPRITYGSHFYNFTDGQKIQGLLYRGTLNVPGFSESNELSFASWLVSSSQYELRGVTPMPSDCGFLGHGRIRITALYVAFELFKHVSKRWSCM